MLSKRLDTSENAPPIFFFFAQKVLKDSRTSVAFLSIKFITVYQAETAPIDSGGNIVRRNYFVQSEIIIRPVATYGHVEWKNVIEGRGDQNQFNTGSAVNIYFVRRFSTEGGLYGRIRY